MGQSGYATHVRQGQVATTQLADGAEDPQQRLTHRSLGVPLCAWRWPLWAVEHNGSHLDSLCDEHRAPQNGVVYAPHGGHELYTCALLHPDDPALTHMPAACNRTATLPSRTSSTSVCSCSLSEFGSVTMLSLTVPSGSAVSSRGRQPLVKARYRWKQAMRLVCSLSLLQNEVSSSAVRNLCAGPHRIES